MNARNCSPGKICYSEALPGGRGEQRRGLPSSLLTPTVPFRRSGASGHEHSNPGLCLPSRMSCRKAPTDSDSYAPPSNVKKRMLRARAADAENNCGGDAVQHPGLQR
ncbi:uncharacterized protein LOC103795502 [Callithrix jacchus]